MNKFFDRLKSFRKDDWMHFTVSLLLCFLLASVAMAFVPDGLRRRVVVAVVALVATLAAGVYKEVIIDENVSFADLRADLFGAVVGAIMSWL